MPPKENLTKNLNKNFEKEAGNLKNGFKWRENLKIPFEMAGDFEDFSGKFKKQFEMAGIF